LHHTLSNERRTRYIVSLLFEDPTFDMAISMICMGFEYASSSHTGKAVYAVLKTAVEISGLTKQWQGLKQAILDCLGSAPMFNDNVIV